MAHDQVAPWLTPAAVAAGLPGVSLDAGGELPAYVEMCRQAAGAYVERNRRDLVTGDPPAFTPTPDVLLGAVLLVSRLNERRGSPHGLVGFGEFGPARIMRADPDVDRLLGIARKAAAL